MTALIDADKPINWLPDANPSKSSLIRGINDWVTREIGETSTPITLDGLDKLEYDPLLLLALAMGYEPNAKMREYLTKYRHKVSTLTPPPTPDVTAFHLPDDPNLNQAGTTLDREMDLMEAREFPADNRHQ